MAALLQILGSRKGPVECIIGATAVGPTLHFGTDSSKLSTKADIIFGNIDVLQVRLQVAVQSSSAMHSLDAG